MKLNFTKMQGAGNDFVVLDAYSQALAIDGSLVRRLADRHFGVGADQILIVERASSPGLADFRYRIFNADGGEVEQCGNGARCFVKFVRERGLTDKNQIVVETQAGIIKPCIEADGSVTVDMGMPGFDPADCDFDLRGLGHRSIGGQTFYEFDTASVGHGETVRYLSLASMGNPHAVTVVEDVTTAPVATVGPFLETHPRFGQQVNVGFLQILDRYRVRLRVWERGAGETLACGTGACAASVVGIRTGLLDSPISVQTAGGTLTIHWSDEASPVLMTGPAETVFHGSIDV
ncbi:MAG: diaminopimelate epimerase [Burkholderiaceae bacterium]